MVNARPKIDVLTPVFNEEENLTKYAEVVGSVLFASPEYQFRILFIDDGSRDRSWEMIREICARDPRFEAIRLSRNFGSHIALAAGLSRVEGDAVATLACDLQDPPEAILQFLERWRAGVQVVWGHRKNRQDSLPRVIASKLFSGLIRRFAMPKGSLFSTGSFFLIDRKVADCVSHFPERNRITFALVAWTGFRQDIVRYDRQPRVGGRSGWTFRGMFKAMYDTFVGFSMLPIRLITWIGMATFVFTLFLSGYALYSWLTSSVMPGWTGLIVAISTLFGIQFLLMGIMGEYLSRIYSEVVRRPLFFVQEETRDK
jgi:dolichol-phosphate mannosyltransferase